MLVLSRKKGESVIVDDRIKITIIDVRGDKVRVGVEAPSDVAVFRNEVWLKIQEEKKVAIASCAFCKLKSNLLENKKIPVPQLEFEQIPTLFLNKTSEAYRHDGATPLSVKSNAHKKNVKIIKK